MEREGRSFDGEGRRAVGGAAERALLPALAAVDDLLEQRPARVHLRLGVAEAAEERGALLVRHHDAGARLADALEDAERVLEVADVEDRQLELYVPCGHARRGERNV